MQMQVWNVHPEQLHACNSDACTDELLQHNSASIEQL